MMHVTCNEKLIKRIFIYKTKECENSGKEIIQKKET